MLVVHIKHATEHNGANLHQHLPKNYLKHCNNYVIGFWVRIGIRVRYRVYIVSV